MVKKRFCCLLLLGVFSFSMYFLYHLSYSVNIDISGNDLMSLVKHTQSEYGSNSDLRKYKTVKEHYGTSKATVSENTLMDENSDICPDPSPFLVGPLRIDFFTPVSLDTVKEENPHLQVGGRYNPADCIALQKVAVIIPFRNRDEHLRFWLHYLHPLLQRQQLDYGVYVINQDGESTFNRAKLMNIGFTEALKEYDYDCFVFSDVDLIPMDDRNTYRCYSQPRHLSVSMDKFKFKLPYENYFGGVCSLSKMQIQKINGFPNTYWGWGGEDDDIFNRLSKRGMFISRPNAIIGKCRMIPHKRDKHNEENPFRFNRVAHTYRMMNKDGLNSLNYKVVSVQKNFLYTNITVDVGLPYRRKRTYPDELVSALDG